MSAQQLQRSEFISMRVAIDCQVQRTLTTSCSEYESCGHSLHKHSSKSCGVLISLFGTSIITCSRTSPRRNVSAGQVHKSSLGGCKRSRQQLRTAGCLKVDEIPAFDRSQSVLAHQRGFQVLQLAHTTLDRIISDNVGSGSYHQCSLALARLSSRAQLGCLKSDGSSDWPMQRLWGNYAEAIQPTTYHLATDGPITRQAPLTAHVFRNSKLADWSK